MALRVTTDAEPICGSNTTFCIAFNAYPFLDVASPGAFALKILGTTVVLNVVGYTFYRLRSRPQPVLEPPPA